MHINRPDLEAPETEKSGQHWIKLPLDIEEVLIAFINEVKYLSEMRRVVRIKYKHIWSYTMYI